jgi:hypothetical protein
MPLRITDAQFSTLAAAGRGVQELPSHLAVELRDEGGEPVPGEPLEVVLPDGARRTGTTSGTGQVWLAAMRAGTAHVTFPHAATRILGGPQGDDTVPGGAASPGGATSAGQPHACRTGVLQRFEKVGKPRFVTMELVDRAGRPRASLRYELRLGDVVRTGSTDASGLLREKVPPGAPGTATLTVLDGEDPDAIELALDPTAREEAQAAPPQRSVLPHAEGEGGVPARIEPVWETRLVQVALGRGLLAGEVGGTLRDGLPGAVVDPAGNVVYESRAQHVRYELTFGDAEDFPRMLATDDALAMYAGPALSAPFDLAVTPVRCRAVVLMTDRGLGQWRSILRARWPRSASGNDAYMLDRTGSLAVVGAWLRRLLSYPVYCAHLPWRGALEYAKRMVNRDLVGLAQDCRVVTA